MRHFVSIILIFILANPLFAQQPTIVMGPVSGHATDSSAVMWVLVSNSPNPEVQANQTIRTLSELEEYLYEYAMKANLDAIYYNVDGIKYVNNFGTLKIYLSKDENVRVPKARGTYLTTKQKNFEFLVGSCAFPFPYKKLGSDDRFDIFNHMQKREADFMLWLGDNVYYLDKEWESYERMFMKNVDCRLRPPISDFMTSLPQYAIWDDHDYGPNDSDGSFANKENSLDVFTDFWPNPSFGTENAKGIFYSFKYEDAEFFMLDNRYHKMDGEQLFGHEQMKWLKAKLAGSDANWKFIVSGSQMLASKKRGESFEDSPEEKEELLYFLEKKNISGVIFLNGDRHYTELNYQYRPKEYPLYEFTCSPLTSIANPTPNLKNPLRVKKTLVRKRNFGRISLYGEGIDRECKFEVFDTNGLMLWSYTITLTELQ